MLVLIVCELAAAFFIGVYALGYLYSVLKEIWYGVRYKEPINKKVFNPVDMFRSWETGKIEKPTKSTVVILIIVCVGTIYFLLCTFRPSTQIGSLLEAAEYTEEYEAIVYIEDKPVHCIAMIDKRGRGDYWIEEILLPYGKTNFITLEEQYNPGSEHNEVYLGSNWAHFYKIELIRPATEQSYTLVENEVVSSYGPYCASKKSAVYHQNGCQSAARITDENLIFFSSRKEADALGFDVCSICGEW